jgi:hypothetical protein
MLIKFFSEEIFEDLYPFLQIQLGLNKLPPPLEELISKHAVVY